MCCSDRQNQSNTLQHAATRCNTRQRKSLSSTSGAALKTTHCNTLQHTAQHCTILHHTRPHCNTLQHTASHCNNFVEHPFYRAAHCFLEKFRDSRVVPHLEHFRPTSSLINILKSQLIPRLTLLNYNTAIFRECLPDTHKFFENFFLVSCVF